jgi:nucleotide-binding universal stress UspA family protein
VVAAVRERARDSAAQVVLLHVAAPEPSFVGYDNDSGPLSRAARKDELNRERQSLSTTTRELKALGIEVAEPILRIGPTVDTVLAVADEVDADTIVVARHRHGWLHDVVLGNTALDIVRRSARPILLIPPPRSAG